MEISKNPEFLKELYSTELYSIKEEFLTGIQRKTSSEGRATEELPEGNGLSGIALLLPHPPIQDELDLLNKILSSIQVKLSETLQFIGLPENFVQLLHDYSIKTIITFGLECEIANMNIIKTSSLSDLQQNVATKKELWQALKQHFTK